MAKNKAGKNQTVKNSQYWENRIANNIWKEYNNLEERNRELLNIYQTASKNVRNELYELAEKYSKDGVLSRTEMYREKHLKELEAKYIAIAEELGEKVEQTATNNMIAAFQNVYTLTMDNLEVQEFSIPAKKTMNAILREPWKGSNFSNRLWGGDGTAGQMQKLVRALDSVLVYGLQTGKSVTQMAVELNNVMHKGFNTALTLVRSESIHYMNQAALMGYKDAGIMYVQILAAVDERTCEDCGKYHEKIYPIDKCPILPFHPNCRCTIIPVTDEKLIEEMEYKYNNAASASVRNTNTPVKFNENYDYSIRINGMPEKVNMSISECARKVAELGSNDGNEHMYLVNTKNGAADYYEKGIVGEVGGTEFWEFVDKHKYERFAFVHNHNTDGYFSETDMRTLLRTEQIDVMIAVRNDAVIYLAEKGYDVPKSGFFDDMFEKELRKLNDDVRRGKVSAYDRNIKREEIIVDGLLKKYTKAGKLVEINGQK